MPSREPEKPEGLPVDHVVVAIVDLRLVLMTTSLSLVEDAR
jgi:hypothetical protein